MTPNLNCASASKAARRGWACVVLLAASSAVHADCVSGARPRTAEEQAYAGKLSAALKAAMPAAPAPLALEREPEFVLQVACKDTPVGHVVARATASYAASVLYSDRVKLTIRVNYAFPGAKDEVLGALPNKPPGFKVHNLVVDVDGYKPDQIEAIRATLDRARLQALIDAPLPDSPPAPAWTVAKPGQPATKAAAAAPPQPAAEVPAAQEAPAPEPKPAVVDQAKDAVNKLRGLFGR
jgi:hypothetical protein